MNEFAMERLMSRRKKKVKPKKPRRKLTAAEKRAKHELRRTTMIIFIHGKQKRVPRPQLIDGLPVDEFIARNADALWYHQNEQWEDIVAEPDAAGDSQRYRGEFDSDPALPF